MTDTPQPSSPSQPSALAWLWLSALLIALDQWSKHVAVSMLEYRLPVEFIPGLWNWTLAHNYGAAFSFLADHAGWQKWLFSTLAVVVSAVIVSWLRKIPRGEWRSAMPFALVVAGALGNLVDRLRLGYVIDFVDWYVGDYHWPVFNLADSCIVVGVAMIVLLGWRDAPRPAAAD